MHEIPEDILLSLAGTEIQSRATACFMRFQAKNVFIKHTLVWVALLLLLFGWAFFCLFTYLVGWFFVCVGIFVWFGFYFSLQLRQKNAGSPASFSTLPSCNW